MSEHLPPAVDALNAPHVPVADDAHAAAGPGSYGLLAQFETVDDLLAAARATRDAGYVDIDAFTPYPVEPLTDALGHRHTRLPWFVLAAGLAGAIGGFGMQWFAAAVHYPWNVGGRPYNSWPMFIPITFESAILCAGLTAAVMMFVLNRLPEPAHPLFNVGQFARATQDGFFLCIEATDAKYEPAATRAFLEELGAKEVSDVQPL